ASVSWQLRPQLSAAPSWRRLQSPRYRRPALRIRGSPACPRWRCSGSHGRAHASPTGALGQRRRVERRLRGRGRGRGRGQGRGLGGEGEGEVWAHRWGPHLKTAQARKGGPRRQKAKKPLLPRGAPPPSLDFITYHPTRGGGARGFGPAGGTPPRRSPCRRGV